MSESEQVTMETLTLAEWLAELHERAGDPIDPARLAFRCPHCEHVATGQDFLDIGKTLDHAAKECIGRHMNADTDPGCDWAAFGLLGTLGRGRKIIVPDASPQEVFQFADPPTPPNEGATDV